MIHTLQSVGLFSQGQEALRKVHTHALDLIETVGIRFHSARALEILHGAGAQVVGPVARIPGHVVEAALKRAPGAFTLCARDPRFDRPLDGQHTYYSQDGCAALTLDFETGERRASRREDIERMARIADALEPIDVITATVSPRDMPAPGAPVHGLDACLRNTAKHVITEDVASARQARSQIELGTVVAGGAESLRQRPIFSNFICTISPLAQDGGGMDAALEFAAAGVPVGFYSMATAGVTAPVTLPGTLAVLNAEVISAIAMVQLAYPGAKVFYCGGPATVDLRTGAYTAASPEALWLRLMVAELARFYGLPSIVGAGATSAKLPGAQAAWENTPSFLLPALSGAGLLFGMGLLHGSNLLAYEELILDAEIGAMVRRIMGEVRFDEEDFAIDLIRQLGPGGVFIGQRHTARNMRRALSLPLISDRDTYEEWFNKGGLSRVEVARQKVREILATHQPLPIPEPTLAVMDEIVAAYSRAED